MKKFNASKNKKEAKNTSVTGYESMMNQYNKDYGNTIDDSSIPNINGLIDDVRKNKDHDQIHEALLDKTRSDALESSAGTLEANIEKNAGPISKRQHKDNDKHQIMPINALSEWHDQQYRDAYKKAEGLEKDVSFWDKYVTDQLSDSKTSVPNNVSDKASQLQDNPERFKDFSGLPTEIYTKDSKDIGLDKPKMNTMEGFKSSMQTSALKDADAMLLHVYFKAAQEKRDLTKDELDLVNGINTDKMAILAQIIPSDNPSNVPSVPEDMQDVHVHADPTRPYLGQPGTEEPESPNDQDLTGNESIVLPEEGSEVPQDNPLGDEHPIEMPIDPLIDLKGDEQGNVPPSKEIPF